jgi:hypothetical protein
MLLFWRGLALVFPEGNTALALALRYVRYALTVVWALALAPWLFVRLGLAAEERDRPPAMQPVAAGLPAK